VWSAVDIQNEGIALASFEACWFLDPGVDLLIIEAGVFDLFGGSDLNLGQELGV
jgi:hypothetical protein